jgi:D-serine dehydratase
MAEALEQFSSAVFRGLPLPPGLALRPEELVGRSVLDGSVAVPIALLKREAVDHNAAWMRGFVEKYDIALWPHGKTSMAPTIFGWQIAQGAEWLSLASATQAHVARQAGVNRILIANQVVNRFDLEYLAREVTLDPNFEVMCFVDSVEGVQRFADALEQAGCPRNVGLLLEIGAPGGRAGVRSLDDALAVARAVAANAHLSLVGLAGYEGIYTPKDPESVEKVDRYLARVVEMARSLDAERLLVGEQIILSAGGSKFFDRVAIQFGAARLSRPIKTVIRCGCYLFHDVGIYEEAMQGVYQRDPIAADLGRLRPALEIWAQVQSRPEPTRAIVAMGRREASYDAGLPVPQLWCRPSPGARANSLSGHRVAALNDQHAFLDMPADSPLEVGDLVGFGISHPCTVFDKWQMLCVIDRDYLVTEIVRTNFT